MKNITLKLFIVGVIVSILLSFSSFAMAATNENGFSASMTLTSDSKLKENEDVIVYFKYTNINAGNGVDTVTVGSIDYDKSVFEEVKSASFVGENDWSKSYAAETNKLNIKTDNRIKNPVAILKVTFKVKSTLTVDSTKIALRNIVTSGGRVVDGGTGDIIVDDAVITISKEKEPVSTTEKSDLTYDQLKKETTNTPKTSTDKTATKKSTLPKTGIEEYGFVAIAVVAVIGMGSYIAYKRMSKMF